MKLETDDADDQTSSYCGSCGKQLCSVDEITERICHECKETRHLKEENVFFCWACGGRLEEMSEIAQGLCHNCKASIIRKINLSSRKPASEASP
jgi:predicted RNA-binding Zn-ribbon protein involved in translation (DUF1610 family)